jgi:hypothetical protein
MSHFSVLRFVAMVLLAIVASPAFAYRPFDSTDGGVADEGEFELEFGPAGYVREGQDKFFAGPAVVANFGIQGDRELVVEGRLLTPIDGTGSQSVFGDTMLSLKQLHRRGSLQDGSGLSIASECSVLLPEVNGESRTGALCYGIASQRFAHATVHLNLGVGLDREHNWQRSAGVIVEGPAEWLVRPVTEVLAERNNAGGYTDSALIGVIWQARENLAFDFAIRGGRTDGEQLREVRLGLTWGFSTKH